MDVTVRLDSAATRRTAVVVVASALRREHLDVQLAALGDGSAERIVVWLDPETPDDLDAEVVLSVPRGRHGLRLAAARNAGADAAVAAGCDAIVFLDADCVPGDDLLDLYAAALADQPGAVACGPVTYLPDGVDARDRAALAGHRRPHPARPDPRPGAVVTASRAEYDLFWSLSFAVSAHRWRQGPRFDEDYEGYGGEDTDFARQLRTRGVPLIWVGGADAYHQHHPTSSPPVQHLDDILRNGRRFAHRWGEWPMTGWFEAFAARGLVRRQGDGWVRDDAPPEGAV